MKAYQLKIMIKYSAPPIWRRVIVPAGINFTQLSIIFNEVMGWSGEHRFEFELTHLQRHIMEKTLMDDFCFNCISSTRTYIETYLDSKEDFTYTYDFGDCWEHSVIVEEILPDYDKRYPQVVKYKGNCPIEDCGGISEYYELLEILKDENHPEYEERKEWVQSLGYFDKGDYDMDALNERLKNEYYYYGNQPEWRSQREIYYAHSRGEVGFFASRTYRVGLSLKEILEELDKTALRDAAKRKGLKKLSKYKRIELAELVWDHMTKPEVMESYFLCMTDLELQRFEELRKTPLPCAVDDIKYIRELHRAHYLGLLNDGRALIPAEVAEWYKSLDQESFNRKRKIRSSVYVCLRAASILYGSTSISWFLKMLKECLSLNLTEEQLKEEMLQIPLEYMDYIVSEDTIYSKKYTSDIEEEQQGQDYYMPTTEEVLEIGIKRHFPMTKELDRLIYFMTVVMHKTAKKAEELANYVQLKISAGSEIQEIIQTLENNDAYVETEKEMRQLIRILNDLYDSTRMMIYRGYKPEELMQNRERQCDRKPEHGQLIDFQKAKKRKLHLRD